MKKDLFSDQAFTLIHEKTLGVPRKINIFVDRILLFGFLEELESIDEQAIQSVAEEMGAELTGSLNGAALTSQEPAPTAPVVVNSSQNVENLKDVLREVEEILETSIKEKIKMFNFKLVLTCFCL